MIVESIQLGTPRPSGGVLFDTTGIDKEAVQSAKITVEGLVGDSVVDTKNHGGPDQAVYAYTRDDYDFWEAELGRAMPGGLFGENLTISGSRSAEVRIGDRFAIGDVVLEATASRIPCAVFADKVGIVGWVDQFRKAERPGIYFRVITPGTVSPGDQVEVSPAPESNVTILDNFLLYYDHSAGRDRVERELASPTAARAREALEHRLARLDKSEPE